MNSPAPTPSSPPERKTDAASVTAERTDCVLNGYLVGEVVARTKGQLKKGWPTVRGIPAYDPPYTGTIILCGPVRALDLDITDPDMMLKVLRLMVECGIPLHATIYRSRSGGSLRVLFVFRAVRSDDGEWPRKRRFKLTGEDNAIDVLGLGQQFVAFNQHPDLSHYQWPQGSPRDRPYNTLPEVTEAQITMLAEKLDSAGLLVSAKGRAKARQPATLAEAPLLNPDTGQPVKFSQAMRERVASGRSLNENFRAGVPDDGMTVDAAIAVLSVMPNNYPPGDPLHMDREQWRDLAFALHAIVDDIARQRNDPLGPMSRAYLDDDARMFKAFEAFSLDYNEVQDKPPIDPGRHWEGTRNPRKFTAGTLVHMARQRIADFDAIFGED